MSLKAPRETTEYQSHNHCQCEFCTSRRNVNAKKWTVGRRAQMLHHAMQRNGCCCKCHDDLTKCTFDLERNPTDFDPNYPVPVNQTALNALRMRGCGGANGTQKSKDALEDDALHDLDRLERLLILEHKTRVNDALKADRLAFLRRTGKEMRPEPLPPGVNPTAVRAHYQATGGEAVEPAEGEGMKTNYLGDSAYPGALGSRVGPETIREAYALAHRCPVTPPPQCRASHQLQDTLEDVRMVTMDPINPSNRLQLRRLLQKHGKGEPVDEIELQRLLSQTAGKTSEGQPKHTLASLRTSFDHPQGTGVVWYTGLKPGDVLGCPQKGNCGCSAACNGGGACCSCCLSNSGGIPKCTAAPGTAASPAVGGRNGCTCCDCGCGKEQAV